MLRLNCDMGESFGSWRMGLDSEVMPYIDMSNIACGFHAGDPLVMNITVKLAKQYGVTVGAHPGYPDLVGFGRRSLKCSAKEIESFIIYQISALDGFCKINGVDLEYVKPHGALYNDMMKDEEVFKAVVKGIKSYNSGLKLMILSSSKNEKYQEIASDLKLIYEVFADRAYMDDGSLMPRSMDGSVLHDEKDVLKRLEILVRKGVIISHTGKELKLQADSMCVHGDNEKALELVKNLRGYLDNEI